MSFTGSYSFTPPLPIIRGIPHGEVIFEPDIDPLKPTHFRMRVFGRNKNNDIRVRSYEGIAVRIAGDLELRCQRCYIFGKRDWEDRMVPIERWECAHLYFYFGRVDDGNGTLLWTSTQHERSRYADWYGQIVLHPLPDNPLLEEIAFAGQIVGVLNDGRVIIWGYKADKRLRNGQILRAVDKDGRRVGSLVVDSRPGDFVLAKWEGPPAPQALAAWSSDRVRGIGAFDCCV